MITPQGGSLSFVNVSVEMSELFSFIDRAVYCQVPEWNMVCAVMPSELLLCISWRDVYKVMLQEMIAGRFNPGGGEAICKRMIANIA